MFGGPGSYEKLWVIPFTLGLTLIYMIASLAETNRTPFDIPEGESELVAGYHTEYSGMKFAMFFFAEYANMFTVSAVITICFFGGWQSPFGDFLNQPYMQAVWFISKAMGFVFVQIWLRWTLPRLRVDQLMYVSWKVMTPLAFVCFVAIAVWSMLR
jgi:NADH-quinone oxidoreductase subunit H